MNEHATIAAAVDVAMVRASQQLAAPLELPPVLVIPGPRAVPQSVVKPRRPPLHPQTVLSLVALAVAGVIVLVACVAAAGEGASSPESASALRALPADSSGDAAPCRRLTSAAR